MAIPDEKILRRVYDERGGNITHIAEHFGKSSRTVSHWYKKLGLRGQGIGGNGANAKRKAPIELPEFPDGDIPIEEIIDSMDKRFAKRYAFRQSKEWFPVKVNMDGPIGVSFIGDPHVDDNGCNWPLLRHHCELHRNNNALFAVNIGDTENNWSGRLTRLYAEQETSRSTAHRLAEWLLRDAGLKWMVWLLGNHDLWGNLSDLFRAINVERLPMEDWQARFKMVFPNGRECKVWASHDFKGHSMWNSLHGPQKAAHMKCAAHIYAAGHTHNWACHQEESASRDFTYWLIRSRGYKFIDDYGEQLGHFPQKEGASVTCIIDPDAKSMAGFVQAFADMDVADDYLQWLRQRR